MPEERSFCDLVRQAIEAFDEATSYGGRTHLWRQVEAQQEVERAVARATGEAKGVMTPADLDLLWNLVSAYDAHVVIAADLARTLERVFCRGEIRPPGLEGRVEG